MEMQRHLDEVSRRQSEAPAAKRAQLDQALRDWIWRQSAQNSADLYRIGCEYFGITPQLPD